MLQSISGYLTYFASRATEQIHSLGDLASRVTQLFQNLFRWFFFGAETPPALTYRPLGEGEGTPAARMSFSSQPEVRPLTPASLNSSASSLDLSSDEEEPGIPATQAKTIDPNWFSQGGAEVTQVKHSLKTPLSSAQKQIASLLCSLGALEKSLKKETSSKTLKTVLEKRLQRLRRNSHFPDLLRENFPEWRLDGVDRSEFLGTERTLSDNFFKKLHDFLSQLAIAAASDKKNRVVIVARGQDTLREYCTILCEKSGSFCLFDFQASERPPSTAQTLIISQHFTSKMSQSVLGCSEVLAETQAFCTLTQYKTTQADFLAHWLIDTRFRREPSESPQSEVLEIVRISPIVPQLQQSFVSIEPPETHLGLPKRQFSNLFESQTTE